MKSVLPGLEAAFPPIEQKSITIWRKITVISIFSKIPLLFRYFWSFRIDQQFKQMPNFRLDSTVLTCFFSQNSFKTKFLYRVRQLNLENIWSLRSVLKCLI
jgi:hypothetical protein